MKLVRYGALGQEKPGLVDSEGRIRDLSAIVPDIAGAALTAAGRAKIAAANVADLPLVPGTPRLGACVGNVGNFIAVGLNYADHAAESGLKVPPEPIIFMKATSAICGPDDPILIPRGSVKTDWEVELAIVIGKSADGVVMSDDIALSKYLLEVAKVAVVPGSAFGAPGFLRMSYAASNEQIREGLRRIAQAVANLA